MPKISKTITNVYVHNALVVHTRTCCSYICSIASPLHITPGSDSVLIDVSTGSHVPRGVTVAGLSHIAVADDEIPPPTSDVVHLHTVDNVWINTSQV